MSGDPWVATPTKRTGNTQWSYSMVGHNTMLHTALESQRLNTDQTRPMTPRVSCRVPIVCALGKNNRVATKMDCKTRMGCNVLEYMWWTTSYLILSYLISSHLISSISSHLILSHLILPFASLTQDPYIGAVYDKFTSNEVLYAMACHSNSWIYTNA